jgi:hypothetical protein
VALARQRHQQQVNDLGLADDHARDAGARPFGQGAHARRLREQG